MTAEIRWIVRLTTLAVVWLLIGAGCNTEGDDDDSAVGDDDDTAVEWPVIEPAPLEAGTADGTLDLPVGLPLACYTGRCHLFGAHSIDGRDSSYVVDFVPSMGVQTRIPAHVVWLRTGDQDAVLVKIDIGYAFDGLVNNLEAAIGEATGVDVTDRVFLMTSHSHSSYGDFSQAHFLFLGHDRYNREIFERITDQATDLAVLAHGELRPAAIGVGLDPSFDPDDEIFRLRRSEGEGLVDAFGTVVDGDYKDPSLYLIRIDDSAGTDDPADDEPMAVLFGWGMHGTIMGEDNPLISSESTGAVELKLENLFDRPVTLMHFQVDGGDMSPAGRQGDFARMESIGELAAPRILALWEQTETSTAPLRLEALVRTVPLGRDMRVDRDGTVDLYYLPYDPDYEPDMIVYGDDGLSVNPYDEFIAEFGAGLCGDDSIDIPFVGMGVDAYPYNSCALVELVAALFPISFYTDLYYDMEFPLWETRSTMIGALGLDQVPVTSTDGSVGDESVVLGFFPGETCTMLGRAFQKRIADEQGFDTAIVVSYAQDHEGYLMTVEDWMRGGYEAQINILGPLEGEFILERMLDLTQLLGTAEAEDPAWPDHEDQDYPPWPLETVAPDAAPGCGTVPDQVHELLWTRDGWRPTQPQPDAVVRRVTDVQHFLFLGGDPALDQPSVTLQFEPDPGSGVFEDVLLPTGEPLTDRGYDMILTYTPDPLVELPGEEIDRQHHWLVEWQAVTDRPGLAWMAGLDEGRYRFVARGLCTDPADDAFPYDGVPYEVASEPFEVSGADALQVGLSAQQGAALSLSVAYRPASRGFRLLHMDSDYRKATPIVGGADAPAVDVELLAADGQGDPLTTVDGVAAPAAGDASAVDVDLGGMPSGAYLLRVRDPFGNTGTLPVELP